MAWIPLGILFQQMRHFIEHEIFLKVNRIRKPKEVLVIVARSRKRPKHVQARVSR